MLMSGNNYPQSYPVPENMLVNTNKPGNERQRMAVRDGRRARRDGAMAQQRCIEGRHVEPQMKQRPRPGGLGAL